MTTLQANLIQNGNTSWVLEFTGETGEKDFQLASIKDISPILEYSLQLQAHSLKINLNATERIDSQRLQLLLMIQQQFAKENVSVILGNPNIHLRRLLRVMQFDRVFEIEEDNRLETVLLLGSYFIHTVVV